MTELSQQDTGLREFRKPVHFTLSADRGWGQRVRLAATDLKDGARLWRLIWTLAACRTEFTRRVSRGRPVLMPHWICAVCDGSGTPLGSVRGRGGLLGPVTV